MVLGSIAPSGWGLSGFFYVYRYYSPYILTSGGHSFEFFLSWKMLSLDCDTATLYSVFISQWAGQSGPLIITALTSRVYISLILFLKLCK